MILLKIKYIGGADATLSAIKEQGVNEVFYLRNDGKAQEGFPIKHTDISIQLLKIGMIRKNSLSPAIQAVTEAAQEGKKVFFHCASGRKHTGTVVTALLMNLGEATTVEEAEKLAMRRCLDISIKPEMRNVLNNMFDIMCRIQNELNSKI